MIKINKLPCPPELTNELTQQLLLEYRQSKKSVWKKSFIEQTLIKSSNYKCCYCETYINEESKYMEIDHFYCKDKYEDRVIDWDNLLPSCKRCNGRKNDYDTLVEPFINPSTMNPKDHLYMRNYRLNHRSEHGKMTIKQLLLNETRAITSRFEIYQAISQQVYNLIDMKEEFENGSKNSNHYRNKIISIVEYLLDEAQPKAQYSATVATDLARDQDFLIVIEWIKSQDLWNLELQIKYEQMLESELNG